MRVCHLTSVHSATDTRIFIKECRSLAEEGYEVHFVVPGVSDSILDGVHIHGVSKANRNRIERMTKTVKNVLEKCLEIDADIYHFHDPELIPVGLKLKKYKKRVIYDVHEDVPKQILTKKWLPKPLHKAISKSFEYYEQRAAKKFDAIIAATPYIRDRFLSLGCFTSDVNNFPLLEELTIEDVSWSDKEETICYVGGITFIRGIKEMTEALSMTTGVTMSLAGNFSNLSEKEIVSKLDGWSKVKELGFLNRTEVKEVYKRSKAGMVVLHPTLNYRDALPVKMFEYMAAGIPVIASNFPLWEGIIDKNECGICVDPLNVEEIAKTIEWLIENPSEAERMGRNGRRAVESQYNWEIERKKLLKVYEALT